MSTTKKTTTTGTFAGLGTAHALQGAAGPMMTSGVNNPFGSSQYNQMMNMGRSGLGSLESGVSRAQANLNRQMAAPMTPQLGGAQSRDAQFSGMRLGSDLTRNTQL